MKHRKIHASRVPRLAKARSVRDADPDARIQVTLHLRHREEPPYDAFAQLPPGQRQYLTPEEFEQRHGADSRAVDAVNRFADAYQLTVVSIDRAACMVELEGTVRSSEAAFGVDLSEWQDRAGTFRGFDGDVHIPEELSNVVEGVVGLHSRHQINKLSPQEAAGSGRSDGATRQSYFPPEVADLYQFPRGLDGSGETIAIIEFGGGYYLSDIQRYFEMQRIRIPQMVNVPAGSGLITSDSSAATLSYDVETATDIQIAGTIAPGARFLLYFANAQSQQHYLTAFNRVAFDPVVRPTVVSISYANAEERISHQEMRLFDRAVANAALMGVTTCVSSGDSGSASGDYALLPPPPAAHVNFPANCPHVLSCGGTMLHGAGGRRTGETVWNDLNQVVASSGGGVSTFFARPAYQDRVAVPPNANGGTFRGRGVPDVAGNASAFTGYKILFAGNLIPSMGGTSCVAPLWAALIARLNQGLGHRCGFVNPALYTLAQGDCFQQIVQGDNGAYPAGSGWNACTGLGSPNGERLFDALKRLSTTSVQVSVPLIWDSQSLESSSAASASAAARSAAAAAAAYHHTG